MNRKYNLNITVTNKTNIEQFILLLNRGLLEFILDKIISCDQAEDLLYRIETHSLLKKLGVNKKILDLIHEGWEMEALLHLDKDAWKKAILDLIDRTRNEMKDNLDRDSLLEYLLQDNL